MHVFLIIFNIEGVWTCHFVKHTDQTFKASQKSIQNPEPYYMIK